MLFGFFLRCFFLCYLFFFFCVIGLRIENRIILLRLFLPSLLSLLSFLSLFKFVKFFYRVLSFSTQISHFPRKTIRVLFLENR